MRISAVVTKDMIKSSNIIKDRLNLEIFIVIALGIISGTVFYIYSEPHIAEEIGNSFAAFCTGFTQKTKAEVFTGLLLGHLPYVIFMLILGKSSIGYIVIPLISYVKIMGIGFLNSYLYAVFGLKGVEYSLLIFLPGKFLMLFSVIFLMQCCIKNSVGIKSYIKGETEAENNSTIYSVRIMIAVIILISSSLIDCILTVSFSSLFSF